MRISIVTGFFLPVPAIAGGATEKIWYALAEDFASKGHSVTFVSRRWPGSKNTETVNGVDHIRVRGFDHTKHLSINLLLDFLWGIRVAFSLPPGDIVICNTITLPIWLQIVKPAAGKVAVMIGRTPKGQVRFYGGVSRIFAPSSYVANQITSRRAFALTRVTGYPINWSLQAGCASQSPPPLTVGFVGRLHPEKGLQLLLRAARILADRPNLPEWRLKIVGPSSIKEGGGGEDWLRPFRSDASEKLGNRIEWVGPEFDPRKLAIIYGGMDIFCYPSIAEKGETFGVSLAEAMASRCAAVVSDLECFRDLVSDGHTGLVFDHRARDAENKLADCIGRLVANDNLRRNLAIKGQQHVRRFDDHEVSRLMLADLSDLTGTCAEKPQ